MTVLALPGVSYAEANWGRWVVRCPRPLCTNALTLPPGTSMYTCAGPGGCGGEAVVVWPPDPQAIEALLRLRPIERTRNWLPGESIADLIAENAAHGCTPPSWSIWAGESRVICDITDGRVAGGLFHEELVAAGRRGIGA